MSKTKKKNNSDKAPQITPLELYHSRIKSGEIRPDPVQEQAVIVLDGLFSDLMDAKKRSPKNWVHRLTGMGPRQEDADQGIYMYGGVGRGKSMLMDLFFECLPERLVKRRVHFHAFMIEVHDYLHARREDGDFGEGVDGALPSLASRISETSRVLCFDEFHVTDVTDAMILGRLFTALFDRDVVVIATSNWEPDRLYEGGLQRERFLPFISLLKNRLQVVHLDSPTDYRTQFSQSGGFYFWPLSEATHREIEGVFDTLRGKAKVKKDSLMVKGRVISVAQSGGGVARMSFAELCEKPRGAEDYLALAKKFHTLILEGIPKMGYDRRNEAKRLMTLVDALYENNTKLIVSADAPPEKLYFGHDHSFEFERTISRLLEMQSEDYMSQTPA